MSLSVLTCILSASRLISASVSIWPTVLSSVLASTLAATSASTTTTSVLHSHHLVCRLVSRSPHLLKCQPAFCPVARLLHGPVSPSFSASSFNILSSGLLIVSVLVSTLPSVSPISWTASCLACQPACGQTPRLSHRKVYQEMFRPPTPLVCKPARRAVRRPLDCVVCCQVSRPPPQLTWQSGCRRVPRSRNH